MIVPMWVPVDTLTVEQKEQYALKQKMKEEEIQQPVGLADSIAFANLLHPDLAITFPMPDMSMEVKTNSDAFPNRHSSLDPGSNVEQYEEGPPLKRQKTDEMHNNNEPNDIATIGTAAS